MVKNRFFTKIAATILCALCALTAAGMLRSGGQRGEKAVAETVAASEGFDDANVALTFGAISDVHIGYGLNTQYLDNTLHFIDEKYDIDALLISGDLTQSGLESEARTLIRTIENTYDPAETGVIMCYGNHDTFMFPENLDEEGFYNAFYDENPDIFKYDVGDEQQRKSANRWMQIRGSDGAVYDFVSFQYSKYGGNATTMTAETENWLDSVLAQITAAHPNRYVFVTGHSPAANTVTASHSVATSVPGSVQADTILSKYPQVIYISGHTHFTNMDDLTINQSTYTQLSLGAETDLEPIGINGYDRHAYSQGCVVEMDKNGAVKITRYEFLKGEVMRSPFVLQPCGSEGYLATYNFTKRKAENTPPQFGEDAKISVKETSATTAELTFDRAHDDMMVFSYGIEVKNAAGNAFACTDTAENGRDIYKPDSYFRGMVDDFNDWTDPARMPGKKTLSLTFASQPAYPYTVSVVAYDVFGSYTPYNAVAVSNPLTVTVTDPTQSNAAAAAAFDGKVNALGAPASLTADALEEIKAIRTLYAGYDYKVRARITAYEKFVKTEKYFYQNVYTAAAAGTAPTSAQFEQYTSVSYKGKVEDADRGVTLTWNSAPKNSLLGFADKCDINGLRISFANLAYDCTDRSFGMIISNRRGDRCTDGECALICFDPETGKIRYGNNLYLGRSENFIADKLGASPFTFAFAKNDDGSLSLTVTTVFGAETYTLPARYMAKLPNLQNTSSAFVYFTPWSSRQSMQVDVTAVQKA